MPKIIVADDEPTVATAVQQILATMDCDVQLARSADEAIAAASARPPDLVLMDIRLDGSTDGITAAETIQRETGAGVVFLTARTDKATLSRAARVAPAGYLIKPFSGEQVRVAVSLALAMQNHDANRNPGAAQRLAAGVAHNLNNLLTIILGRCEMMEKRVDPADPLTRHLSAVREASVRGAKLAKELLDYAGVRMRLDPVPFALDDELAKLLPGIQGLLAPDYRVLSDFGTVPFVFADPIVLHDVVFAIARWARDGGARPGIVQISTSRANGGVEVQISIEADGISATAAEHRQFFEPFFLLNAARPVAGLELPAARGLMGQSGGTLRAEATASGGTRFRLAFPLAGPTIRSRSESVDSNGDPAAASDTPGV